MELPDWIIYPTGGGTGMVGMWKAFSGFSALGWIDPAHRPHMVTVQAAGCAPIVRAFADGAEKAAPWEHAHTIADGLRAARHRRLPGPARCSTRERRRGCCGRRCRDGGRDEGPRPPGRHQRGPESGAGLHALRVLISDGRIKPRDRVVLFNTGGALKYLDVLQ